MILEMRWTDSQRSKKGVLHSGKLRMHEWGLAPCHESARLWLQNPSSPFFFRFCEERVVSEKSCFAWLALRLTLWSLSQYALSIEHWRSAKEMPWDSVENWRPQSWDKRRCSRSCSATLVARSLSSFATYIFRRGNTLLAEPGQHLWTRCIYHIYLLSSHPKIVRTLINTKPQTLTSVCFTPCLHFSLTSCPVGMPLDVFGGGPALGTHNSSKIVILYEVP